MRISFYGSGFIGIKSSACKNPFQLSCSRITERIDGKDPLCLANNACAQAPRYPLDHHTRPGNKYNIGLLQSFSSRWRERRHCQVAQAFETFRQACRSICRYFLPEIYQHHLNFAFWIGRFHYRQPCRFEVSFLDCRFFLLRPVCFLHLLFLQTVCSFYGGYLELHPTLDAIIFSR